MPQKRSKGVSRKFQRCFKSAFVLRSFKGISSKLHGGFKRVSREFQGFYLEDLKVFKCFSKGYQGRLKKI